MDMHDLKALQIPNSRIYMRGCGAYEMCVLTVVLGESDRKRVRIVIFVVMDVFYAYKSFLGRSALTSFHEGQSRVSIMLDVKGTSRSWGRQSDVRKEMM